MRQEGSFLLHLGVGILVAFAALAVLAPVLAPYDAKAITGSSLEPPSAEHLLGTNDLGQDILSGIIRGSRTSLAVALGAAVLTVATGTLVGMICALAGRWVDVVLMRLVDMLLALPLLPLLVLVAALVGPGRAGLILVIGLLSWPETARLVRSQAMTVRQRGFVGAARGFGARPWHVVRRHLGPALGPLVVTSFVVVAGSAAFLDAALAFLGLGDPTAVSWGQMLIRALRHPGLYFTPMWVWWVLPPGFAIALVVLGFTFLGVGLEPRLNPRTGRMA